MEDLDPISLKTMEHLDRCSNILTGLPQCMINVNYTRQEIGPDKPKSKQKKGTLKRETVCKFCFTPIPLDHSLEEHTCSICKRKTKFEKKSAEQPKPEPKVLNAEPKKKKKKVKDVNAGLFIPTAMEARPAPTVSAHDLKMKNQKKEKLAALLSKKTPSKSESKLQDFLKLVQ